MSAPRAERGESTRFGAKRNSYLVNAALVLGSLLVLFLFLEGAYRLVQFFRHGSFQTSVTIDPKLGWRTSENYSSSLSKAVDFLGAEYRRSMATNEQGSRLWRSKPGGRRVLFIGDSFTEAADVSNDKTYFSVFSRMSSYDVYAYGAGGYSTLQEYLVLERLFDSVKPDYVVLQFCRNDFHNNSLEWERSSIVFSQRIRPYIDIGTGQITFDMDWKHPYTFAISNSRVLAWASDKVQRLLHQRYRGYSYITDRGYHRSQFLKSAKFKRLVSGKAKLMAFNCSESEHDDELFLDSSARLNTTFKNLAEKNGFTLIEGGASYVDSHDSNQVTTKAKDGAHLNELGNRLWGEYLARYFQANGL
jgi:lysophospholipase L1-like esterase